MKRQIKDKLSIITGCFFKRTTKGNFLLPGFMLVYFFIFFIFSCKPKSEKHAPGAKVKLGDLIESPGYIVVSDIKAVLPIDTTVIPEIKAIGSIEYDPEGVNSISARFGGRIEKLYIRHNFQDIRVGQKIMDVYSPEINNLQQDLLYLVNSDAGAQLISSSKQRLLLMGLSQSQIDQIISTGKIINPVPVYSPYSGHVHEMNAKNKKESAGGGSMNEMGSSSTAKSQTGSLSELSLKEGSYIEKGDILFGVYDMKSVRIELNIYPQDAYLVKVGNKVKLKMEGLVAHEMEAAIDYMEPLGTIQTNMVKARINLPASEGMLHRPGTLINAEIQCDPIKGLWLPGSAVLDLGNEKIAFVKKGASYMVRRIETGFTDDARIKVMKGLQKTDSVAWNAQYILDSEGFVK
jgi:Cu(I)/Ag(I) efflux system membrane fusion protein